jgi:hypothetical protein
MYVSKIISVCIENIQHIKHNSEKKFTQSCHLCLTFKTTNLTCTHSIVFVVSRVNGKCRSIRFERNKIRICSLTLDRGDHGCWRIKCSEVIGSFVAATSVIREMATGTKGSKGATFAQPPRFLSILHVLPCI